MKYAIIIVGVTLVGGAVLLVAMNQREKAVHVLPPERILVVTEPVQYPLNEESASDHSKKKLMLSSPVFENGEIIPIKYTCDGANINPPIDISGVPAGTATLVLIMDDHDVPRTVRADGVWDHWVVFNIPPDTIAIGEGQKAPGVYGVGTNKKASYLGPCPPDREHRYEFRLYALDVVLALSQGATKTQVLAAMEGHVIKEAELIGRYERR